MLLKIHQIIEEDTRVGIRFRHLHAESKEDVDFQGILSWTVDQHRGQAKGMHAIL